MMLLLLSLRLTRESRALLVFAPEALSSLAPALAHIPSLNPWRACMRKHGRLRAETRGLWL